MPPKSAPTPPPKLASSTLSTCDYAPDANPLMGFADQWVGWDTYVMKVSQLYTIHEIGAAREWACSNGATRVLDFGEWMHEVRKPDTSTQVITEWSSVGQL